MRALESKQASMARNAITMSRTVARLSAYYSKRRASLKVTSIRRDDNTGLIYYYDDDVDDDNKMV